MHHRWNAWNTSTSLQADGPTFVGAVKIVRSCQIEALADTNGVASPDTIAMSTPQPSYGMRDKLGADHFVRTPFNQGDVLRRLADVRSRMTITRNKSLDARIAMSASNAVTGADHKINGVPSISSCAAADLNGKRYADVMRDIRTMMLALEQNAELRSACISSTYAGENGQE